MRPSGRLRMRPARQARRSRGTSRDRATCRCAHARLVCRLRAGARRSPVRPSASPVLLGALSLQLPVPRSTETLQCSEFVDHRVRGHVWTVPFFQRLFQTSDWTVPRLAALPNSSLMAEPAVLESLRSERIMSTTTINPHQELIEKLTPASTLILHEISWEEYEEILHALDEAKG